MSSSAAQKARKVFDNRYEILSIVGRGHCSVVYHARHIMSPSSEVALKVLQEQKDQRSNAERLRREALAMVSARHRYVIRLDDFHSVGDLCYLSMEYAPESDLRKFTDKHGGVLDPVQAETFLGQVLDALGFLHKTGIIHRDIKPDNVLVIDEFEVRLGDFGVAVLPGTTSSLEELQRGVGTMDYMAPEVLAGTGYESRSDIYALGVTFYELLSGVHPFRDAPLMEQLTSREDGKFKSLSDVAPEVPSHLAKAIMRAMSYNADDRFASAKEFAKALSATRAQGSLRERFELEQEPTTMSQPQSSESAPATPPVFDPITQLIANQEVVSKTKSSRSASKPVADDADEVAGMRATRSAKRTRTRRRTSKAEVDPSASEESVESMTESESPVEVAPLDPAYDPTATSEPVNLMSDEEMAIATPETAPITEITDPAAVQNSTTELADDESEKQLQAILDQISSLEIGSEENPSEVNAPSSESGVLDPEVAQFIVETPPVIKDQIPGISGSPIENMPPSPTPVPSVATQRRDRNEPAPKPTVTSAVGSAPISPTKGASRVANEPTIAARVSRSKTMRIDREMVERIRAHNAAVTAVVTLSQPKPGFGLPVKTKKLFFTSLAVALFLVTLVCGSIFLKYNHDIDVTAPVAGAQTDTVEVLPEPVDIPFPMLPSGIFAGTVTGLIPGRDTPLTILSFPKRKKLVFIVGVEGWDAASVSLEQWEQSGGTADPSKPIRVASNGFLLELAGDSSEGVLIGTFVNLVTGEEGAWRAAAITR